MVRSALSIDSSSVLRLGAPSRDVVTFLQGQDFMREFADDELKALADQMGSRIYRFGDVIMTEGEPGDRLCFIYRGAADVIKRDPETGAEFPIARLERGSVVGEMSFMDGEPASATVKAAQGCAVVFITNEALHQSDDGPTRHLQAKLTRAVALAVIRRMRNLSGAHVESMRAELAQARLRNEFARFFVVTMLLFALASTVQKVISADLPPTQQMLYSWGFLLLTFAPIAWFSWRQRLPRAAFGLTRFQAGKSLVESATVAAVVAVVALLVKVLRLEPGEALLTWGSLHNYTPVEFAAFFLLYGPHSFLQELIGRGVIQGSLQRFLTDSRPIVPVLVTSALFGIFHLYVSLSFALITFAASLVFGKLYQRHGTLLGVTLLHYAVGAASVAFGFN